ncbi:MAG TPA: hypothetical protein VKB78_03945 [Pirellulales bacterium]|nr:hypothetical protein [Pirellulales bacterium]
MRFSLRTLFIVVALAAATCWVVTDRERLIHEQDEALQNKQLEARRFANREASLEDTLEQFSHLIRHMKQFQAKLEAELKADTGQKLSVTRIRQ